MACPTLLLHCNWFHHEQFGLVGRLFDLSGSYVSSLYLFAGVTVVAAASVVGCSVMSLLR